MLVGHVAVGFAAKRFYPALSLGTLAFAALLADVLWCVLMRAGIEHVTLAGGRGAANYFNAIDIAWSHSLATGAMWALLVALLYCARARLRRGFGGQAGSAATLVAANAAAAVTMRRLKSPHYREVRSAEARVLAAVVLSHWVLDVIAHRPDMPLAPGIPVRLGLGLWTSIPATVVVEGGLWVAALALFARLRQGVGGQARTHYLLAPVMLWSGAALITLAWYNNIAGPPPADARTAPIASLVFFTLIIAWACAVNRLYSVERVVGEDRPQPSPATHAVDAQQQHPHP
jgi:hypothetical protein